MIFLWHGWLVCGWATNHGQDARATMRLGVSAWEFLPWHGHLARVLMPNHGQDARVTMDFWFLLG